MTDRRRLLLAERPESFIPEDLARIGALVGPNHFGDPRPIGEMIEMWQAENPGHGRCRGREGWVEGVSRYVRRAYRRHRTLGPIDQGDDPEPEPGNVIDFAAWRAARARHGSMGEA